MVAEVITALGAIKSAGDTVKSLVQLRDISLVREKAIELHSQILAAQESALNAKAREATLIAEIHDLKEQIAQLKQWDADKQAYELCAVGTGAFAYACKPDAKPSEPPHWLCAKCFNEQRKSLLQYAGRTNGRHDSVYACGTCGDKVQTPWSNTPEKLAEEQINEIATTVPCPYCGKQTRLLSEKPHPQLGDVGVKSHRLQCMSCEKTLNRDFTGSAGYT